MKKLLSLLMAITLVLIAVPASVGSADSAQVIDQLAQIVAGTLDEGGLRYTYDAEDELFELDFSLDSTLSNTSVTIYLYDDMVSVVAASPLQVAAEHRDKMAKYLTLANNEMYYGQFRMDYESGHVSCRSFQLVEGVLPGSGEISVLLDMPVYYMEVYGDGIAQIAIAGADPDAAFQAAQDNM